MSRPIINRRTAAALLASLFILSCPVMASGGGGDGTGEDSDSNAMTYITIGLIVVIGGFFVLDVIANSDSDEDTVTVDYESNQVISTGINWDEAFSENISQVMVAVCVFPGENGSENAMQFISILRELAGDNIHVYHDPVDLGTGSVGNRAIIASEFFGADYLVFRSNDSTDFHYGIASPDSILWTSIGQSDNSMLLFVDELLHSGVF